MRNGGLQHVTRLREVHVAHHVRSLVQHALDAIGLAHNRLDAAVLVSEEFNPLVKRLRLHDLLHLGKSLGRFPAALQVRIEKLGCPHGIAEDLPELQLHHAKGQMFAVLRLVDVVSRRRVIEVLTLALTAIEAPTGIDERIPPDEAVEHRDVDVRALAGDIAGMQSSQQRLCNHGMRRVINQRHRRDLDAIDRKVAACRLHIQVVACLLAARIELAVTGDGAVDDARVDGLQRVVIDTELLRDARTEALDNDIGLLRHLLQIRLRTLVLQVEGNAFLIATQRSDVVARAILQREIVTAHIAKAGILNLDNASAHVGKHLRSILPGQIAREIEYGQIGKCLALNHYSPPGHIALRLAYAQVVPFTQVIRHAQVIRYSALCATELLCDIHSFSEGPFCEIERGKAASAIRN